MLKIINVAGARPNFIKIAALVRAMSRHGDICFVLCILVSITMKIYRRCFSMISISHAPISTLGRGRAREKSK